MSVDAEFTNENDLTRVAGHVIRTAPRACHDKSHIELCDWDIPLYVVVVILDRLVSTGKEVLERKSTSQDIKWITISTSTLSV